MGITRWSNRYRSRRDAQTELRLRLRDLAASRVRYGYRRLTVLLRREGWHVNTKRIYRLYREEGLQVRIKQRGKRASHARVPLPAAERPNQRWSMDFVSDQLAEGRWFRILTVIDQYTRECLWRTPTGRKRGKGWSSTCDAWWQDEAPRNRSPRIMAASSQGKRWTHGRTRQGVKLDFIQPGRPVQNGYIESFNGRLRDECLKTEVFADLKDAREKVERWRQDYNQERPHSSLADRTPKEFAGSAGQRPFALQMVNKAGPLVCQGFAIAGHKAPALDTPPAPVSGVNYFSRSATIISPDRRQLQPSILPSRGLRCC